MNVDNTIENDPCGTILSGQHITGDIASRGRPRIVELTVRQENGDTETYSWESMTKKKRHRMAQELCDFMSADCQRARYKGYRTRQARKCLQEGFGLNGNAEAATGGQSRRPSNSGDSSGGDRAPSDSEGRIEDSAQNRRRKRARKSSWESTGMSGRSQQGSIEPIPVGPATELLMIGDEKAVMAFFRRILADGQQGLCKKLAKWWIRAINPNKQTNYPYAKGPERKPPWWPLTPPNNAAGVATKGTMENGFVRHKEPDHLAKPERLTLLPYMLNQVTDPRNRRQLNDIDVTKLYQISMDSINNENTEKDKHESWRRFVNEIFRVALQQERYKNGETDDTTAISVQQSYGNWRHKELTNEAEEDSISDGEYDDGEGDSQKVLTPGSLSDQDPRTHDQIQAQCYGDDIKHGFSGYVNDAHFCLNFQDGIIDQPSYRRVNNVTNHMSNQESYGAATTPLPRSYQQPNLVPQESFRRHSDTPDRFPSQSSFVPFLPSTNMAHITNPQYQSLHHIFQLPVTSNSPAGPVLPPPLSTTMVRPLADIPQFPVFHDSGFFPRSSTTFQASVRNPISGGQGNLHQISQRQQSFHAYLQNQEYDQNAPKIHVLNLSHATRPEFTYDQDTESNPPRSEFSYEIKSQSSLEPGAFDLDDMTNGESNSHS